MLVERDNLGLSLGLSPPEARCPSKLNLMPLSFEIASHSVRKKVLASPEVEESVKLRGIDVNRALAMELEINENAEVSSPNSTASTGSPGSKRGHDEEHDDRDCSRGASDEEDGEESRKKLRLSKDQSAVLEESFKEHNTLNPKQKLELAKQLNLRPRLVEVWFQNRRARDLLKNLRRHKDEDAIKGQALKNQKALWDKTLEFRFLLQKAFSASNKLPQEPVKLYFCNSDTTVDQAYLELISSSKQTLNSLLELQEALLENNHSITRGNGKDSCKDDELSSDIKGEDDEEWSNIYKSHDRIAGFRNISVDNWHRKTQVITGAAAFRGKLNAFNQNVSDQINGYMRDPNRMIKRMHLRSSSVGIFGKVPALHEKTKEEDGNFDGDPELLDDSEFYLQLLKELFESCDPASSESAFHALKKLHPKKRKVVDRRASKSRKIRYNVHEKIVNFMAPVPMNLPPMAPKLFENLYGMGNSESAAA